MNSASTPASAGLLVKLAKQYTSSITIEKNGKTCDMRKLMAVMGMGIRQGEPSPSPPRAKTRQLPLRLSRSSDRERLSLIAIQKDRRAVNCPPFVRQYGILFRKWGVFVCRKRKSKRHIVENSKLKSLNEKENLSYKETVRHFGLRSDKQVRNGSASIWKKAKRLSCWNVEDEPVPPVGRRKVGSQSWISK